MNLESMEVPSPLGTMICVRTPDGICALDFLERWPLVQSRLARRFGNVSISNVGSRAVTDALTSYFTGLLDALDAVAVDASGTPFQQRVWAALRRIPIGQTTSYGQLAARLGCPNAARAVGLANGRNPVAIIVPCHRVIGADGSLTGYAGGIERKRWLLAHEHAAFATTDTAAQPLSLF